MKSKKKLNKGELTIDRTVAVESESKADFPIKLLLFVLSMVSMFCMVKIFSVSFNLFESKVTGKFNSGFSEDELTRFWVTAMLVCGVICTVSSIKKYSVRLTLGLFGILSVFFALNYKYVANGFVHALNKIVYSIADSQGVTRTTYYVTNYECVDPQLEAKFFYLAVIWVTCFIAAYAVMRRCNPLILACCVALYSAPPLAYNLFVGEKYMIIAAVCCVVVFVVRISGYKNPDSPFKISRVTKAVHIGGSSSSAAAFQQGVASLLFMLITFGAISAVYQKSDYERSDAVEQLSRDITSSVQNIGVSGIGGFSAGTSGELNNGDIYRTGNLKYTGETMFKMSLDFSIGSPIYLRSYTASNYDGKRWSVLPAKTYRQYSDMWDAFKSESFYPQFMYGNLSVYTRQSARKPCLTIKNEAISDKVFLTNPNLYPEETESLSGAEASYDNAFRAISRDSDGSYTQTISAKSSMVTDVYFSSDEEYDNIHDVLYEGDFSTLDYDWIIYGEWIEGDDLPESDNEYITGESFMSNEKQYRQFVIDNYTSYPDSIEEIYQDVMSNGYYGDAYLDEDALFREAAYNSAESYYYIVDEETGEMYQFQDDSMSIDVVNNYYNIVISMIRQYLDNNAEYSLTPGATPYGKDFVNYFLQENHKGYCVHFATASTLLLRRAGIPARYVEGYYVSESDLLDEDEDGFVSVPDSRAHAWTEVYYPLVGWQVVDFTPAYDAGTVPEENDSWKAADTSSDEETDSESESSTDTESDNVNDSDSDTQSDKPTDKSSTDSESKTELSSSMRSVLRIVKYIVIAILIIAALIVCWLLVRFISRKIIFSSFASNDSRKSAAAMYKYALRLMKRMEISPQENEGEQEFAVRLCRENELFKDGSFKTFTNLALTARFGKDELTDDKLGEMRNFVVKLSDDVYQRADRKDKFIIKYILFLH